MSTRLADKVCLVTGATGIAAAGARAFAAEGANVFVVSRRAEGCVALVEAIAKAGGTADYYAADLTVESEAVAAVEACLGRFGRIDGLYAVAGGSGRKFGDGPLHEVSADGWDQTLKLNGYPAFLMAREVTRALLEAGRGPAGSAGSIILVSSVLASSPSPEMFATHAYAAVKGAEVSLMRSMAAYYAPHGIRVNVISPGLVRTPMAERAATDPSIVAFSERKQPLIGGFLQPEHIAPLAVMLLSDESVAITGQEIAVDGGWSVTDAR